MAGTPEMQEQFLTAMDGGNAEIAGANFGRRVPKPHDILKTKPFFWTDTPKMQEHFLTAMDGGNAEIAGANFGRRVPKPHDILKTKSFWLDRRIRVGLQRVSAISHSLRVGAMAGWRPAIKRSLRLPINRPKTRRLS